jgi:predicted ArsR family transcriptional regulator
MLELPPDLRQVMNLLMRQGRSAAAEIAASLEIDVDQVRDLLETLVARGHVRPLEKGTESAYEPILGRSRRPRLSSRLWEILKED